MYSAARELLESCDNHLFTLLNSRLGRPALDEFFLALSSLGAWPILLIAAALLSHAGRRALRLHLAVLLGLLVVLTPASRALKRLFHRHRPIAEFAEPEHAAARPVRLVGPEALHRKSFPSGHTMLAFYTMMYAGLARPGCRRWCLVLASGVALARVYVGAHFPLDCLAGAGLGAGAGWLAWRAHRVVNRHLEARGTGIA